MKLIFLCIFAPWLSLAEVEVAFLEIKNQYGQIVQLEPGGKYAHVAISYRDHWLHAHPRRGVEMVSLAELEEIGEIKMIVKIPERKSLPNSAVRLYLGKPYDSSFSWSDEKIYCSELIAKLLGIQPRPMTFDASIWPQTFNKFRGELGISADEVFESLKSQGYKSYPLQRQCAKVFK